MASRVAGYRPCVTGAHRGEPAPGGQVTSDRSGGELSIGVSGDLDMLTSPSVERRIVDLIARDGVADVRIDLSDVGFFDSAGVRTLVVAKQEASRRHLPLRVTAASPQCRRVLQVSGLESMFDLRPAD
jgi:anti-sigma B factor antagonist